MAAYHGMFAHFPLALLYTAVFIVLLRFMTQHKLAVVLDNALVPVLVLAILAGLVTIGSGFYVWSWQANMSSSLVRNHIEMGSWSIVMATVLCVSRWRMGNAAWTCMNRTLLLVIALLTAGLLTVAGTLGGNLAGNPSGLPSLLMTLGWDIEKTFYLPDYMLLIMLIGSLILVSIGWMARKRNSNQGL